MRLASFYSRVSSDTIDFRFRFSAESPSLLSVAHTVSAECDTSLSAYFRSTSNSNFDSVHLVLLRVHNYYKPLPFYAEILMWSVAKFQFSFGLF